MKKNSILNLLYICMLLGVMAAMALPALAQPNITYRETAPPPAKGASNSVAGNVIEGGVAWLSTNQAAMVASKWTVAPYATYAPDIAAEQKWGGGLLIAYGINEYVSAAVGLDWLGELSMPSGSVELHKSFTPFASLGLTNLTVTPFVIAGVATPLSGAGSDNKEMATLYGGGLSMTVARVKEKPLSIGAAWVQWDNAGDYSGQHLHTFVALHF